MTLDEAIKHSLERAEQDCTECANEHKQLAEWLVELKELREKLNYLKPTKKVRLCIDCKYHTSVLSDFHWCNINGQDEPIDSLEEACDRFELDEE